MERIGRIKGFVSSIVIGVSLAGTADAQAQAITPELGAVLQSKGPDDLVPVILELKDRADVRNVTGRNVAERRARIVQALRRKADATQGPVVANLRIAGAARIEPLWIVNAVAATVPARVVPALAQSPAIAAIRLDATLTAPVTTYGTAAPAEWNLEAIRAPAVWGLGYTGVGTVIASMDTGVDLNHPDLRGKWRGGGNSWFDPYGQHRTPYDANGHGTQTMGVMVGGGAGGTAVGVAPDAQWIAVKIFDDLGRASLTAVHRGFQWLLDPDGNPATNDAPALVNNSWGTTDSGQCVTEFQPDIQVLKQADIAVVFSAGNTGPSPGSSVSPGNNAGVVAVGAVDGSMTVAGFSSRGPSACDAAIYPRLVTPGVTIRTTDLSYGGNLFYATVSGTSFAAPHVAGAMALLKSAFPTATVSELEAALQDTAKELGAAGADMDYGYGLMDVAEAYNRLLLTHPANIPTAVGDAYSVDQGSVLRVAAPGVLANDTDPAGAPLTAALAVGAAQGVVTLNADGSFEYTPNPGFSGADGFSYTAGNGTGSSSPGAVTVTVNAVQVPPPEPPADTDADGDGYPVSGDCNDNDPSVHPGAPEVKHDGVDQDCNGYDLTIDIVRAEYSGARGLLTVNATSALGSAAKLTLDGYGGMSWNSLKRLWTITVRKVAQDPGAVTVSGVEGAESAPTTAK